MKMIARKRLILCVLLILLVSGVFVYWIWHSEVYIYPDTYAMSPTVMGGDLLYANRVSSLSLLNRGDLVVYMPRHASGEYWVGRIIGMPGEVVDLNNSDIAINGSIYKHPVADYYVSLGINGMIDWGKGDTSGMAPVTYPFRVPDNSVFILGDNPIVAYDSRYMGGVNASQIVGKVAYIQRNVGN